MTIILGQHVGIHANVLAQGFTDTDRVKIQLR